jgi:hypothetical protein
VTPSAAAAPKEKKKAPAWLAKKLKSKVPFDELQQSEVDDLTAIKPKGLHCCARGCARVIVLCAISQAGP